jgi:hypothetical protein
VDALEGHQPRAVSAYRDVLAALDALDLPWERALVAVDMATVLDATTPETAAAVDRAYDILASLRARPLIARLDDLARRRAIRAGDRDSADRGAPRAPLHEEDAQLAEPPAG